MLLLNENEAKALTGKILSYVTADDASASVSSDKLSHLRFAGNNFLTSGQRVSRGANVTVWIDGKRGSASTNDLDDASLKAMVLQAEKLARLAPVDREYMPTLAKSNIQASNRLRRGDGQSIASEPCKQHWRYYRRMPEE